ncbi:hypothetical protein D3C80_1084200 [compost metagenome]
MGSHATESDVQLGGSHKAVATAHQFPGRYAGADMHGGKEIDVIDHAGFHHRFGSTGAFLGRLEDQLDAAMQLWLQALENARQP